MLDDHAHVMQVKLCKANTQGVTPTLLWRVLNLVGYAKPPHYFWGEVVAEGQPWYDVRVTILAHADMM